MSRKELEKAVFDKAISTGLYTGWEKELAEEIASESDKLLLDYMENGEN